MLKEQCHLKIKKVAFQLKTKKCSLATTANVRRIHLGPEGQVPIPVQLCTFRNPLQQHTQDGMSMHELADFHVHLGCEKISYQDPNMMYPCEEYPDHSS